MGPGVSFFEEDRQDARVWLSSASAGGSPVIDSSRSCGVAVERGGRHLYYRADPGVRDLEELVRPEGPPEAVERLVSPASGPVPANRLAICFAAAVVRELVRATGKLEPRAVVRAEWVGFDQGVRMGRSGRGVVADRRQGRRVRLQADLDRAGRAARAVGEAVLRSDSEDDVAPVLRALAEAVAARVATRVGAERASSGERPVVFAPGVGGVLIHELVGHALEGDVVLGGASWLAGSGAEPFRGPREMRVVDDPRRGRASWRLDDEGEAARATALIRDGRPVGWLLDRSTARLARRDTTGHGRRASFRDPVRPRMGCTFLAAGSHDPDEALHGIEDGVYVRRMESASTDTRRGIAVFRVTDADRIHGGRIVAPLASHVLHVNARAALSSVEHIARDLAFDTCIGSCLHHGQALSISVGAPTFRIGSATVHS
jgi:TldD protein